MHKKNRRAREWYSSARHRAQRRKSAWNLILIPLGWGAWIGIWYGLFRLVWSFHVTLYPQHRLGDFWREGIRFSCLVPSFLMVFAVLPGSIGLGLASANCIARLIPSMRKRFDAESVGHAGTSFGEATGGLLKFAGWALSIGLVVALFAAATLKSLK
jgi:hypothetical protein